MPPDTQRSPRSESGSPAAAATSSGPTFTWAECDVHPWYGVSVMVTGGQAMCVPPLDGTPNHYVEMSP